MRHLTTPEEIFIASFLLSLLSAIKSACKKPKTPDAPADLGSDPLQPARGWELAPGTDKVRKEPYLSLSGGVSGFLDKPSSSGSRE